MPKFLRNDEPSSDDDSVAEVETVQDVKDKQSAPEKNDSAPEKMTSEPEKNISDPEKKKKDRTPKVPKNYVCELCGESFARSTCLTRHIKELRCPIKRKQSLQKELELLERETKLKQQEDEINAKLLSSEKQPRKKREAKPKTEQKETKPKETKPKAEPKAEQPKAEPKAEKPKIVINF